MDTRVKQPGSAVCLTELLLFFFLYFYGICVVNCIKNMLFFDFRLEKFFLYIILFRNIFYLLQKENRKNVFLRQKINQTEVF